MVEDPIELRKGDGDEEITDDGFGDDAAIYFGDGSKAAKQAPNYREGESQTGERGEVVVGASGVSEGVEEARDDPDDAERDDNPANNLTVCQVVGARNQQQQLEEGDHAREVPALVNDRRGKHHRDEARQQQLGAIFRDDDSYRSLHSYFGDSLIAWRLERARDVGYGAYGFCGLVRSRSTGPCGRGRRRGRTCRRR